jgi:hypothetical protein
MSTVSTACRKVRNDDRAADDQRDVHRIIELGIPETRLCALDEVIIDTIVASNTIEATRPSSSFVRPSSAPSRYAAVSSAKNRLMPRWVFSSRIRLFIRSR